MKKPKVFDRRLNPCDINETENTSKNPRSTVATVTEIYDYMSSLARIGITYSPFAGKPIVSHQ